MKLTIEPTELLKGITNVKDIADFEDPYQIIIACHDNKLTFLTNNREIDGISKANLLNVSEGGAFMIKAQKVFDIAKILESEREMSIEQTIGAKFVTIRSGTTVYQLPTEPAINYRNHICFRKLPNYFHLSKNDLFQLFYNKIGCMDEGGYLKDHLKGLYLHIKASATDKNQLNKQKIIHAVAADSYKLAVTELQLDDANSFFVNAESGITIPRATVNQILRHLDNDSSLTNQIIVKIEFDEEFVRFKFNSFCLTSYLIKPNGLNYEYLLRLKGDKSFIVNIGELRKKLETIAAINVAAINDISLVITKNSLSFHKYCLWMTDELYQEWNEDQVINAQHVIDEYYKEQGEAIYYDDEMQIEYSGEPFEISMNIEFFLEITSEIQGDYVSINFVNEATMIKIRDTSEQNTTYCLMLRRNI